jgi:hypothetical protein
VEEVSKKIVDYQRLVHDGLVVDPTCN